MSANNCILLQDTSSFWQVESGTMDIFVAPIGRESDRSLSCGGEFCFRVRSGNIVFGVPCYEPPSGEKMGLWGIPSFGSKIVKKNVREIIMRDFDLTSVKWIDSWVQFLDQAMGQSFILPRQYKILEADPNISYQKGENLSCNYMDVVWVKTEGGVLFYSGEASLAIPEKSFHPVTHWATIGLAEDSSISGYHTPQMMLRDDFEYIFQTWQSFSMKVMSFNFFSHAENHKKQQQTFRQVADSQEKKIHRLLVDDTTEAFSRHDPVESSSNWRLSLMRIGCKIAEDWGVDLPVYHESNMEEDGCSPFQLLEKIGFGVRRVDLQDWNYRKSMAGYLIVKAERGEDFVAFLPPCRDRKGYTYFNPQESREKRERALKPQDVVNGSLVAFNIYPPMPDSFQSLKSFFCWLFQGRKRDIKMILLIVLFNAVLFVSIPLLGGEILTRYIPGGERSAFTLALLGLCIAGFANLVLHLASSLFYISLNGHFLLYTPAYLWKKIITFPSRFFHQYPPGEILERMSGVQVAAIMLNVSLIQYLSACFSGVVGLVLLFYYNAFLTTLLMGIIALIIFIDIFLFKKILAKVKKSHVLEFKANDFILQVIHALPKIRVARRGQFVLLYWAQKFCAKRKLVYQIHLLRSLYQMIHSHFLFYSNMALFLVVICRKEKFPLDYYIVFNMALVQLSFFINQFSSIIYVAIEAIPFLNKITPLITNDTPKTPTQNIHPQTLRGRIEFSCVSFSYPEMGGKKTPVLKDISFTIEQGEYVAIVGPSGSGKSTLVRLILGLEKLQSGAILLDQYNLEDLNIQSLREQFGVVLQSTQILPTNVIKNIAMGAEQEEGEVNRVYKQVWSSLSKASLEKEIARMPMGLYTHLGRGENMSGGQRQRLLVARALNKNPRILLFDEATSAMDNITQGRIKKMLDGLNITRIVIAHRLSTITNVNRIIMIDQGKIVEQGSYQGLLQAGGKFAKFAQRQLF